MLTQDLLKALLGFLVGLAAKMLYDLWSERRRRQRLVFRKMNRSSFSIDQLTRKFAIRLRSSSMVTR
jgi:hypothetical protein